MWTRRELKEKGKLAMHRNYWKTVLVSLILVLLLGGVVGGSGLSPMFGANFGVHGSGSQTEQPADDSSDPGAMLPDDLADELEGVLPENADAAPGAPIPGTTDSEIDEDLQEMNNVFAKLRETFSGISLVAIIATILFIALIAAAVAIAMSVFLLNPLEAGGARYFLRNLNAPAEIKELAFCYDHGYLNTVKTIFFKDLYTILWSLLLIIPGIIKAYEYRMIPYLLAEDPEMPTKEAFARSKALMRGQKWKTFVLDLSFIGWGILSLLTLGILGIFYVNPYRNMTNAALYERLVYGAETPARLEEVAEWTES